MPAGRAIRSLSLSKGLEGTSGRFDKLSDREPDVHAGNRRRDGRAVAPMRSLISSKGRGETSRRFDRLSDRGG